MSPSKINLFSPSFITINYTQLFTRTSIQTHTHLIYIDNSLSLPNYYSFLFPLLSHDTVLLLPVNVLNMKFCTSSTCISVAQMPTRITTNPAYWIIRRNSHNLSQKMLNSTQCNSECTFTTRQIQLTRKNIFDLKIKSCRFASTLDTFCRSSMSWYRAMYRFQAVDENNNCPEKHKTFLATFFVVTLTL